jgi:hypothetical protein
VVLALNQPFPLQVARERLVLLLQEIDGCKAREVIDEGKDVPVSRLACLAELAQVGMNKLQWALGLDSISLGQPLEGETVGLGQGAGLAWRGSWVEAGVHHLTMQAVLLLILLSLLGSLVVSMEASPLGFGEALGELWLRTRRVRQRRVDVGEDREGLVRLWRCCGRMRGRELRCFVGLGIVSYSVRRGSEDRQTVVWCVANDFALNFILSVRPPFTPEHDSRVCVSQ